MSILKDVMSLCIEKEIEQRKQQMIELQSEVITLKKKFIETLDKTYVKFVLKPVKMNDFIKELSRMNETLRNFEKLRIKDRDLYKIYLEVNKILEELEVLSNIHESLLEMDMCFILHKYGESFEILFKIMKLTSNPKYPSLLKYFLKTIRMRYSHMLPKFDEMLKRKFVLKSQEEMFSIQVNEDIEIDKLIISMIKCDYINKMEHFQSLLEFIKTNFFISLLTNQVKTSDCNNELNIQILEKKSNYQHLEKICYHTAKICDFLEEFLILKIDDKESRSFLEIVGDELKNKVSHMYVEHIKKIPTHSKEFESIVFQTIVEISKIIENKMSKIGVSFDGSLIKSAMNLEGTYRIHKNEMLMNATRSILVSKNEGIQNVCLKNKFDENSKNLVISNRVKNFVDILHNNVEENRNNKTLIDMIRFYRTFMWEISKKFSMEQAAMLTNDLEYISYKIKEIFENDENEFIVYEKELDELVSKQILNNSIQIERKYLLEILCRSENFNSGLLHEFSNRLKCLRNILSYDQYVKMIGTFSSFILETYLSTKNKYSEEEFSVTLEFVIREISDYFSNQTDEIEKYIPNWKETLSTYDILIRK